MKLLTSAALFLIAFTPVTSSANDGYVDGMVIAQFSPQNMPSAAQVSLDGPLPFLGRPDVDQVLRAHGCYRIGKFLATYDRENCQQ